MKSEIIKKSLAENTATWIFIWVLIITNIFTLLSIGQGCSYNQLIISFFILLLGIVMIKILGAKYREEQAISVEITQQVAVLMEKIKPICDGIFEQEINRITMPILAEIEQDFTSSMTWLWENNEDYLLHLQEGIAQTRVIIQLDDTVSHSKMKIIRKLQEKLELLLAVLDEAEQDKTSGQEKIKEHLQNKALELKQGMEKEKDLFYEYVEKLLQQQIMNNEKAIDFDCLNIDVLGKQFSVVVEKSVGVRLGYFKDSIIKDLEYMAADIVGKMQKEALQMRNVFSDIEELIELLTIEYRDDDPRMSGRLHDAHRKIAGLGEQANDFLVTLAWQDILIEKRWQDIQIKLFMLRDEVLDKVSTEVVQYIIGILNDAIPGYANMTGNAETTVVYKACLDAEIIYQLAGTDNIRDLINDGVYALLQFIRPVELMVGASLRLSEKGIAERRCIKEQLRQPEYQQLWDKVMQEVRTEKPELLAYIENSFPFGFASFCNSPYIRQKPENAGDAAWILLMAAIEKQNLNSEVYLLAGLLLVIQSLRNKYIHPLKSIPLPLEHAEEIEYLRFCAYKSIEILLTLPLYGMVRNRLA